MSLVEVIRRDSVVAERPHEDRAADSQDHLLCEPVARVAAVEVVGQTPVALVVLRKVGIEQVNRHRRAGDPMHHVAPNAERNGPPFDLHLERDVDGIESRLRVPVLRFFALISMFVEALREESGAMHQTDGEHR